MTDVSPLSTAFIVERPQAAAKVLSNLPPVEAARLIAALPSRITAPAVAAMPPLNAAHCIAEMPSTTAASILQNMAFQGAASVLRIVDEACRKEILKDLPRGVRREFLRSLRYPADSVGAWMDQFITPLNGTQTVAEALQYAKQRQRQSGEKIFVVDNAQTYLGTIRISDLLLLDGKTVLSQILEERERSVSSRSTLAVLISDDSWSDRWSETGSLAVVGRKGNLLGVITRTQVKHGLASMRRRPTTLSQESLFTHMFAALVVTLNGLAGLMTHSSGSATQAPHGKAQDGR
jgi:Mg/Co/Ni transporter MgtE